MSAVAPSPLPQQALSFMGPDGRTPSLPWYRWFQNIQTAQAGGLTPAQVNALIAAALIPVNADIANALAIAEEALAEAGGSNAMTFLSLSDIDGYDG